MSEVLLTIWTGRLRVCELRKK